MKTVLVAPEYPPHNIGGGGIVVQSIAQALSCRGRDVTVVSGYYPTRSYFEKVVVTYDGQAKVFWFPLVPTPRTPLHLKTVMPPNIFSAFYLVRFLLKRHFSAFHLHGFGHLFVDFAALLCTITGKRYIVTLHGFPSSPQKVGGIIKFLYSIYLFTVGRLTLHKASKVTVVSSAIKKEAVAYGVDENRIVVIPNGLDLAKYEHIKDSMEFKRKFEIDLNDRLIVSVGILHERKGFQYLIRAMSLIKKQYENIKLVVVGRDGGYEEKLKELARRLHVEDQVVFTGFLDFKMKLMAMHEAEVFVIPSLVEPFGLVALEAMAVRKPIVATKVDGLKEVLEEGETAIMVQPNNNQELAKAIIKIFSDVRFGEKLAKKANEKIKDLDWNDIVDRYLNIYCNCFVKKPRRVLNET
jgi:glycosyltransferase involved in cell wall biosynthesis